MSKKTSLYRYFSNDHVLLYVGISKNPFQRAAAHSYKRDLSEVRHIEIEWFGSEAEAKLAEATVVHRERPQWNIALQIKLRKFRTTALPIAPPEKSAESPKPQKPAWFGPPMPWYVWGFGGVSDVHNNLHSEMPETALPFYLRYGDALVVADGASLPDHFERHCKHKVYVLPERRADAVHWVKMLARKYTGDAKRTAPDGWDGILLDADGRPVHTRGIE